MNIYTGHPSQFYGVEEHRLVGGKGDGLRLLQVRTGGGLEYTVSPDRCADIARLSYKGYNFGFFAPAGYAHPANYDKDGEGFLKTFTAGFMTTCGFFNAGAKCVDMGEELSLHGNIGNTPAERVMYDFDDEKIYIKAVIRDARLFGRRLVLTREITSDVGGKSVTVKDSVKNDSNTREPIMVLYHCNMGYPLLSEKSKLFVPADSYRPRDPRAAEGNEMRLTMEKPQSDFAEQCYFYDLSKGQVAIYNPDIGCGVSLEFDRNVIDCFTEWKLMEAGEYALGLEPGNCLPTGRAENREAGRLKFIDPGETLVYGIRFTAIEKEEFEKL